MPDLTLPPTRPQYGAALIEPVRERDWSDRILDLTRHPRAVQAMLTALGGGAVYVGLHVLARLF